LTNAFDDPFNRGTRTIRMNLNRYLKGMIEVMDDNRLARKNSPEGMQAAVAYERRNEDRRKVPSEGFSYISVVGWICRREQCRRQDDKIDLFQTTFWHEE